MIGEFTSKSLDKTYFSSQFNFRKFLAVAFLVTGHCIKLICALVNVIANISERAFFKSLKGITAGDLLGASPEDPLAFISR